MMTEAQKFTMLQAMRAYGGGFVSALADAWSRADATNSAILEDSFASYVRTYGPGSRFFDAVATDSARAA